MAAYATAAQLAQVLRIQVTPANQELLDQCLAAAASEIDFELDRITPLPDPAPEVVVRTNINRGVEWFKATDAAFGVIGTDQTGVLTVPKDGFARHAVPLWSLKEQWGVA